MSAAASTSAIELDWSVSGAISSAQVYRDTDSNPSGRTRLASVSGSVTSYSDRSASAGVTYYYWIKFAASGTNYNSGAASASITEIDTGCGSDVCLSAVGNPGAISLSWETSETLSSVEVYRDTDSNPSGRTRVASLSTSARSYTDTSVTPDVTYYYWVKYDLNGSQSDSSIASAVASGVVTGDCEGETSGEYANNTYYVTPNGSSSASGESFSSAMDIDTALSLVGAGEMILMKPGTYAVAYKSGSKNTKVLDQSGTSNAPIKMVAANCGRAVFDFSFPEQSWVQDSFGFDLTGDYWYFKGIEITRAGYQGVYVKGAHNTFENCAFHHNRNTGLEINKGGSYTTVINSDAYRNYDPKKNGSMADGFGPKQTQGPGNKFIGCRAWENSDDGFDMYDSPEAVVIENSWAFRNGVDVWGYGSFSGNGNGFKLGGNRAVANNRIVNSVSFGNPVKGFDQNNNAGGITVLNCTSYSNGTNYGFGNSLSSGEEHYFRNNVSVAGSGSDSISNADQDYNSWNGGVTASTSDFVSVNTSLATVERNVDGSLPDNGLFRLKSGSDLIDAGAYVGLPSLGSAPDLGAFEKE